MGVLADSSFFSHCSSAVHYLRLFCLASHLSFQLCQTCYEEKKEAYRIKTDHKLIDRDVIRDTDVLIPTDIWAFHF